MASKKTKPPNLEEWYSRLRDLIEEVVTKYKLEVTSPPNKSKLDKDSKRNVTKP